MKILFILLLGLAGGLFAQEEEAKKAATYFEAREYAKAMDLYEVLLKQPLTPWQKSVAQYNAGCVLFAEGKLTAAIAHWRTIPLNQDSFPLLSRRIHTNIAVARLLQARQIVFDQTDSFERGLFYLQESLAYTRKAIQEECALQKLEGAVNCRPAKDLVELYLAIKTFVAIGSEQWRRFEQEHSTPSQRLFLLLGSISLLQQRLNFLEGRKENVTPYLNFFNEEGKSWLPLWESTEKEVEKLEPALRESFSKARHNYETSLADLRKRAYPESMENLNQAFNQLTALANQIGIKEPIATAIRRLLGSYQLALIEEPLQELTIAELLEEQKRLMEPVDSKEKPLVDLSTQDLALSLKALKQSHFLSGRFYFEEARYQLTKILRPVKRGSKPTPLELLINAQDEQHQAIVLNRLVERMEGGEKNNATLMEQTVKAQQAAVSAATPFLDTVYAQQVHDFQQPGSLIERCQAHPWDEVLPLYEKGYRSSIQAAIAPPSLIEQEQAMHSWNKALILLKKPKEAFKGTCQGSAGQPKEGEGAPEKKSAEEKPAEPMKQVLQNIQKMEQEDRKPQPAPVAPKGERPW